MRIALCSVVAAILAAGSASGAVLTYNVSGIFSDGSRLGGRFSFDDQNNDYSDQFSEVSVAVTGTNPVTTFGVFGVSYFGGGQENQPIRYGFYPQSGSGRIELGFLADYTNRGALRAITSASLITDPGASYRSFYDAGNGTIFLTSGSVTPVPVGAAVPEPATWGMMLLGFGLIGAAARRRKSAFVTA